MCVLVLSNIICFYKNDSVFISFYILILLSAYNNSIDYFINVITRHCKSGSSEMENIVFYEYLSFENVEVILRV